MNEMATAASGGGIAPPIADEPALVVDLDGTLLRSDLLIESGLQFLRAQPHRFWEPWVWLTGGKAHLKARLARDNDLDVTRLPYAPEVIARIQAARQAGRRTVLATASNERFAQQVGAHLGLFDEIIASDGERNLSAHRKRDALVARFGDQGFDYIGNAHDDLPILAAARRGYLANPESGVARRAARLDRAVEILPGTGTRHREWLQALRLHQWLKNLLIFIPLLAAHQATDPLLLGQGVLAFLFFSLCASSVYLLNDLLDLPEDRQHPIKRHRPFAAGRLSIKQGLAAVPVLLLLAFGGAAWLLPWTFTAVLGLYYLLTLAYSLSLKRQMMVDVIVLAALYTMRVLAGAAAFGLPLTFWILGFSMFMFLSLALLKRYAELRSAADRGRTGMTPGRGYAPSDLEMLAPLGTASGYLSVLVLALYIQEDKTQALYTHPQLIWLACPLLLFWVSRAWMLTHRGQMNEDPLLFAIRDPSSLIVGFLLALVFWMAI